MSSSAQPKVSFTASYRNPNEPSFDLESRFEAISPSNAAEKSAWLAKLRESTVQLQADINRELTHKMEEEKTRAASSATLGSNKAAVDDAKEEENYGEEVAEEDD